MFDFIKKFFIFLLPLGLIFIFPILVLYLSGEYTSISDVITAQEKNPKVLYGLAYHSINDNYKQELLTNSKPEVVAFGGSTGMQMRREFFSKPDTFVNISIQGSSLGEIKKSFEGLPLNSNVKFVLVNLSPGWFESATSTFYFDVDEPDQNPLKEFTTDWRLVYKDYFDGKFTLSGLLKQLKETGNIGLNALINKNGFTSDGAYHFGNSANDPNHKKNIETQIDAVVEDMKKVRGYHSFGENISETAVGSVKDILKLASDRGIYVIGYTVPFPSSEYSVLMSKDDGYRKKIVDLPKILSALFSEYGFGFYNFLDIGTLGASDSEFSDIAHASDKIALREIIYMTERDKRLNAYFDLNRLREMLKRNANNDFLDL